MMLSEINQQDQGCTGGRGVAKPTDRKQMAGAREGSGGMGRSRFRGQGFSPAR